MPTLIRPRDELVSDFMADVGHGDFADYEVASMFSGQCDQPIQLALRHWKTLRVVLIDYPHDGTIHLPNKSSDSELAA